MYTPNLNASTSDFRQVDLVLQVPRNGTDNDKNVPLPTQETGCSGASRVQQSRARHSNGRLRTRFSVSCDFPSRTLNNESFFWHIIMNHWHYRVVEAGKKHKICRN